MTATLFEQHLSALEFGQQLIETGDLDPIYIMLVKANMPSSQLQRWLLGYWWFYSAATASRLSVCKGQEFYAKAVAMGAGLASRGTERRHFRGEACLKCIEWFYRSYPKPEAAVHSLHGCKTFTQVSTAVRAWPMFGPWIAFKVADMLDSVLNWPVDFSDCDLLSIYTEPREGAELLAKQINAAPVAALAQLIRDLNVLGLKAPPHYQREIRLQEAETILCKWKSYLGGHYYIGKDCKEIREALQRASDEALCRELIQFVPKGK